MEDVTAIVAFEINLIPRPLISGFGSTRIHVADADHEKDDGATLWEIFIERDHDVDFSTSSPNCEALSDPNRSCHRCVSSEWRQIFLRPPGMIHRAGGAAKR